MSYVSPLSVKQVSTWIRSVISHWLGDWSGTCIVVFLQVYLRLAKYKTAGPASIGDFVKGAFFLSFFFSFLFFFPNGFRCFRSAAQWLQVWFVPLGSSYRRYSHERNTFFIILLSFLFFSFSGSAGWEGHFMCVAMDKMQCSAVRRGGFPNLFGRPEIDDGWNHSTSLGMWKIDRGLCKWVSYRGVVMAP